MGSLAVEENNEGITLLPLDELEVSRFKIFGNEYLYLYILQFIFLDARTIISFQQTCNANRNWNSVVLKRYEWEWRWKKIEALIGKEETDQMKQGANCKVKFYLYHIGLNADACKILAPALAEMKGLKKLGLNKNNIGDEGCRHLGPALAEMKGLEVLYLDKNNIGDEGCRHLAPALAEMKGLNRLTLMGNNIGEEGETVIQEAWKMAGKEDGLWF